jgi:hypothetical protein
MGPVEEVNYQEKEGEVLGKREAPARDRDGGG